jgi:son of sevenless-like protein
MFSHKPPKSITPKKNNFEFMDLDPIEVARQLTLIDSELFRAIKPYECMGQPWNKPNAAKDAPNITKMIHR